METGSGAHPLAVARGGIEQRQGQVLRNLAQVGPGHGHIGVRQVRAHNCFPDRADGSGCTDIARVIPRLAAPFRVREGQGNVASEIRRLGFIETAIVGRGACRGHSEGVLGIPGGAGLGPQGYLPSLRLFFSWKSCGRRGLPRGLGGYFREEEGNPFILFRQHLQPITVPGFQLRYGDILLAAVFPHAVPDPAVDTGLGQRHSRAVSSLHLEVLHRHGKIGIRIANLLPTWSQKHLVEGFPDLSCPFQDHVGFSSLAPKFHRVGRGQIQPIRPTGAEGRGLGVQLIEEIVGLLRAMPRQEQAFRGHSQHFGFVRAIGPGRQGDHLQTRGESLGERHGFRSQGKDDDRLLKAQGHFATYLGPVLLQGQSGPGRHRQSARHRGREDSLRDCKFQRIFALDSDLERPADPVGNQAKKGVGPIIRGRLIPSRDVERIKDFLQ